MKTGCLEPGEQLNRLIYGMYSGLGTIAHFLIVATLLLTQRLVPGWHLSERLGRFPELCVNTGHPLIWIHAASVGEVQAAKVLIKELADSGASIFLTTMTRQGREVARTQLPGSVCCSLVPLDTPQAVGRALQVVCPDLYICMETELWPVMLTRTRQAGIPMLLLNGRMSERSAQGYRRIRSFMAELLSGFTTVAVIGERDRERYSSLGVASKRIQVCGNIKYNNSRTRQQVDEVRKKYREALHLNNETVFICGSTRSGEEELLLPVFQRLRHETATVWIIAPRHLKRLNEIRGILDRAGLEFDLMSNCLMSNCVNGQRTNDIVIVDSLGLLADLYSVGDYNFCGGSLMDKGGHNIMESIHCRRPVFFGPAMKDFQDAVDLVLSAGAGFQVKNGDSLADMITGFHHNPDTYQQTIHGAAVLAESLTGVGQRQAEIVQKFIT